MLRLARLRARCAGWRVYLYYNAYVNVEQYAEWMPIKGEWRYALNEKSVKNPKNEKVGAKSHKEKDCVKNKHSVFSRFFPIFVINYSNYSSSKYLWHL